MLMLKRPYYIVLILVVLLTMILLSLPGQTVVRVKLAIGSLFLPLFGLANSSHQLAEKAGEAVVPRSELLKVNEALRRDNQQLRLREMHAAAIQRENDRLRQLFGWQQKAPWKPKLANVVLRDPANWWRTIQIDLGSRDGARVNLPVMTTEGLVGRISEVSLTSSRVVLVGDRNCKVSAMVEDGTRDTGVLETAGPFDSSLLTLSYLPMDANLKPGQNVVTSGLGGVFPQGIAIGKIVDTRQVEFGLYTEARVRLAVNLSALEEVWVLLP